jgi:hypothetical protein
VITTQLLLDSHGTPHIDGTQPHGVYQMCRTEGIRQRSPIKQSLASGGLACREFAVSHNDDGSWLPMIGATKPWILGKQLLYSSRNSAGSNSFSHAFSGKGNATRANSITPALRPMHIRLSEVVTVSLPFENHHLYFPAKFALQSYLLYFFQPLRSSLTVYQFPVPSRSNPRTFRTLILGIFE